MFEIPFYGQLQFVLEQDTLGIPEELVYKKKYGEIASIINNNSGIDYQYTAGQIATACNYIFIM